MTNTDLTPNNGEDKQEVSPTATVWYWGFANPFKTPRLFELCMSSSMILCAVWLLIWPQALQFGAFYRALDVLSPMGWAILYFVVGSVRLTALIANSRWGQVGRWIRAITAAFSGLVWSQLVVALILNIPVQGFPSLAIPVYSMFIVTEVFASYRAMARG